MGVRIDVLFLPSGYPGCKATVIIRHRLYPSHRVGLKKDLLNSDFNKKNGLNLIAC